MCRFALRRRFPSWFAALLFVLPLTTSLPGRPQSETDSRQRGNQRALQDLAVSTKQGEWGAVLFAGSGSGKTLAAETVAAKLNLQVYRVDLASVVSKYVQETEKNLSALFRKTEEHNLVLFFDEADALFDVRSDGSKVNDQNRTLVLDWLCKVSQTKRSLVVLSIRRKGVSANTNSPCLRRVVTF